MGLEIVKEEIEVGVVEINFSRAVAFQLTQSMISYSQGIFYTHNLYKEPQSHTAHHQ